MKKIIILVAMLFLFLSGLSGLQTDKICHFTGSAILYRFTYDILDVNSDLSEDHKEGIAFWVTFGTGIGKEVYDEYKENPTGFDTEDLSYDIGGLVSSLLFNRYLKEKELDKLQIKVSDKSFEIEVKF